MAARDWLLFTAQTPASPSSLRVLVWRRMQNMGAVTLHNGVWILPRSAEHEQNLWKLVTDLEAQGGNGLFFVAQTSDPTLEQRVISRFQAEREQEYAELEERCMAFLHEIEREALLQKFTFAELEENEDDLNKLTAWLRKISARDFFAAPRRDPAVTALARCQLALRTFTSAVYERFGLASSEESQTNKSIEWTGIMTQGDDSHDDHN